MYKRSARLSNRSKSKLSNGTLLNFISTDVSRVEACAQWFVSSHQPIGYRPADKIRLCSIPCGQLPFKSLYAWFSSHSRQVCAKAHAPPFILTGAFSPYVARLACPLWICRFLADYSSAKAHSRAAIRHKKTSREVDRIEDKIAPRGSGIYAPRQVLYARKPDPKKNSRSSNSRTWRGQGYSEHTIGQVS